MWMSRRKRQDSEPTPLPVPSHPEGFILHQPGLCLLICPSRLEGEVLSTAAGKGSRTLGGLLSETEFGWFRHMAKSLRHVMRGLKIVTRRKIRRFDVEPSYIVPENAARLGMKQNRNDLQLISPLCVTPLTPPPPPPLLPPTQPPTHPRHPRPHQSCPPAPL